MNDIVSAVLQSVLGYVLPLLAVSLTGLVVAKIRETWRRIEMKQPDLTYEVMKVTRLAIAAAEQAGAANLINDKKKYALNIAEKWLSDAGIKIDLDLISAAIEAAIFAEFNRDKSESSHQNLLTERN